MYYCEYGVKNYLSVIYMYLWTFRNKKPKFT